MCACREETRARGMDVSSCGFVLGEKRVERCSGAKQRRKNKKHGGRGKIKKDSVVFVVASENESHCSQRKGSGRRRGLRSFSRMTTIIRELLTVSDAYVALLYM